MQSSFHTPTGDWLIVNTHPHREDIAIRNLHQQNFNVYCPMTLKRMRHARRAYDAHRPLFPSYLFVEFMSAKNGWRSIRSTYGVRSLVGQGDKPSLIAADFVAGLKSCEVDGMVRKPINPFAVGQRVSVQGGPLDGLIGQIIEMRENDRLLVLLNHLVKVNLLAENLRPVDPAPIEWSGLNVGPQWSPVATG